MKKWLLFYALTLSIVIVDLDMSAVNIALATMATELNLSLSTAQWIVDGYTIAAAALAALGGRLGEMYGARRVLMVMLVIFAMASLGVGLANSSLTLIMSRIFQGCCTAVIMPVSVVAARHIFPPSRQGFIIGLMISVASVSQALGPTFGGFMIKYLDWRWIFLVNVPLAVLIWLAVFYLLAQHKIEKKDTISWRAVSYLVGGLFLVMLSLNEIVHWGLFSWPFWTSLIVGTVLLVLFIRFELHDDHPLLELKLLINKVCGVLNIIRILSFFVYFTYLFTLSIFLQNVLDFTPVKAGLILLFMTLFFGLFSIPSGRWIDKIGYQKPLSISIILLMVSTLMMSQLSEWVSIYYLAVTLIIAGISIALLAPSTTIGCLDQSPPHKHGAATGLLITSGFIGISLGVAISGSVLSILNSYQANQLILMHPLNFTAEQHLLIQHLVTGTQSMQQNFLQWPAESVDLIHDMVRESFSFGFHVVMWFCSALCLVSYVMNLRFIQPKSSRLPIP